MIDLESASFVKYRGPYYTSSSKYPHNRFGYEALGFLRILRQLADIKNIRDKEIENRFYKERRRHLGRYFLSLLGVMDDQADIFLSKHQNHVIALSDQFEKLAKKTGAQKANFNLYMPIADDEDPSLLDMSNLFMNLAKIYKSSFREKWALGCLVRKATLPRGFLRETKNFIHALFKLLALIDSKKCLGKKTDWKNRLQTMNQDLPSMFALNDKLKYLAESYRLRRMSAEALNVEITKLCKLPYLKTTK